MEHIGKIFRRLGRLHRRMVYLEYSKVGLTEGQPKVLEYLAQHDGCMQKELAENCHVKASTITSVLGIMERDGLIDRKENCKDRRMMNVWLTDKGKKGFGLMEETYRTMDHKILKGLTQKEKETLTKLLERVIANLENEEEKS